jgi:hypothetical protein
MPSAVLKNRNYSALVYKNPLQTVGTAFLLCAVGL